MEKKYQVVVVPHNDANKTTIAYDGRCAWTAQAVQADQAGPNQFAELVVIELPYEVWQHPIDGWDADYPEGCIAAFETYAEADASIGGSNGCCVHSIKEVVAA